VSRQRANRDGARPTATRADHLLDVAGAVGGGVQLARENPLAGQVDDRHAIRLRDGGVQAAAKPFGEANREVANVAGNAARWSCACSRLNPIDGVNTGPKGIETKSTSGINTAEVALVYRE
jgi:hypothetical protein